MLFKKPYRNVVGLSQAKLDELLKNFEKLKDFGVDLFDRVVRYVLDDEDESVLGELAGKNDAAHALVLMCSTDSGMIGSKERWSDFFSTLEPVDCRFYLRLGKVFEATAGKLPESRFCCQAWFENALWLEILLQEGNRTNARSWSSRQCKTAISGSLIENMLKADGRTVDAFVTSAFRATERQWENTKLRDMVLSVANLGQTYAAHRDLVAPFLREGNASTRQIAVENLACAATPARPFIAELVECATDSSKLLREATEVLVRTEPQAARPLLEKVACDAKAAKREQAVRLLRVIYGSQARDFLQSMQATEKSAAVKEAIANSLRELHNETAAPPTVIEPLPSEPIPLHPPITPALRECLEKLFAEYNEFATQRNAHTPSASAISRYARDSVTFELLDSRKLEATCNLLQKGGDLRGVLENSLERLAWPIPQGALKALLEHPDWHLVHAVRFLSMLDAHSHELISWGVTRYIEQFRRSHARKITLRELAEVMRPLDIPADAIVDHILGSSYPVFNWEADAVWPFFSDKLEALQKALDPAAANCRVRFWKERSIENAIRVISKFPQVPPSLVGKLWEMAIGTSRADRSRAQKVLVTLSDLPQRLAQALSAHSSETRAVAAEWIARLGDRQYAAPLHKAAKAEKNDAALDEMLIALEKLGESIEPYLDRETLLADAPKALKKGTPPALEWFPWGQLPRVHWQDSGDAVPAEVITWLLVQNFKLKSPEAGPLLRRYCAMLRPADRAELGQFVLAGWLDQDLKRKYSDAECRAKAQQQAPARWWLVQQSLQWYQKQGQTPPASFPQTLQQVEESLFHSLQREVGSATAEKGVLAVAGACCNASAVGSVQKYLKEWYGYRAAQCKALIAMLSTIDHSSATQFLLSIANRFRTKGIREEAERYVNALAERKGWTLDELADRTLPTAGFDDDGSLELSFGPRQFQLRVTPNLEAVLTDPGGKTLKALPAPRKDDDEEQAKAAKKAFSAAKAELKKFASMQNTRLYEAMCMQRTWTVADWQTYLVGHPLMKFLCQRLVWAVCDGDRVQSTFRPLDDGTFTNYEDIEVQLPADAKIRIAHRCQIPAETASAWATHLADYSVTPLFTQFGRETYTLPEEKRKETAISEFCGHMVEAFKLRSLATKFGYTRGQAQDG
ncbi:MAG: DUF4132 domain-containing protein, partial [Thermoguttaceae bacterium]